MLDKETRTRINQANAKHSTGPRTPEGKAKSSLNALRHGITSQVVVMPHEDLEAYKAFTRRYQDDFQPKGVYEEQLVQSLADTQWRLNRLRAQEHALLALAHNNKSGKTITGHPEVHATLATVSGLHRHIHELNLISLQGQRLSKELRAAHKELADLQAAAKTPKPKPSAAPPNSTSSMRKKTRNPNRLNTIQPKMASFSRSRKSPATSISKPASSEPPKPVSNVPPTASPKTDLPEPPRYVVG